MPYAIKSLGTAPIKTFNIVSGKMIVTDPCYDKDTWCQIKLDNVATGQWFGTVTYSDERDWGIRVAQLDVWYGTLPGPQECDEEVSGQVGVDSGQASFFDLEAYPQDPHIDKAFYDMVCKWTLSGPKDAELVEAGVYTLTGTKMSESGLDWMKFNEVYSGNAFVRCGEFENDFEVATLDKDKLHAFILANGYGSFGGNEHGVACSSGYGDGGYLCYVRRDMQGTIVAATVKFIGDEKEDEDEEE